MGGGFAKRPLHEEFWKLVTVNRKLFSAGYTFPPSAAPLQSRRKKKAHRIRLTDFLVPEAYI